MLGIICLQISFSFSFFRKSQTVEQLKEAPLLNKRQLAISELALCNDTCLFFFIRIYKIYQSLLPSK
jgi:hypothetical protein